MLKRPLAATAPEVHFARMIGRFVIFSLWVLGCAVAADATGVDAGTQQLIVATAPDWNTDHGTLRLYERDAGGPWRPVTEAWPVLFGKNGLAWGRGVAGQEEPGLHKVEKDKRAPAGIFQVGEVYGYEAALPPGGDYPYHQVTEADAWVDDPRSPHYNEHVIADPRNLPAWFSRERMKSGDFAYHWLIEVEHNEHPAIPGQGSAIFFHIRRGETHPTSGCTTMAEENLVRIIRWLRREKHPEYVLLPEPEYAKKREAWGLPAL
jgi:L,D-peptidoglycan transpeptidase YkuD (ErfK/YbiS/YcfS/YnhG family)